MNMKKKKDSSIFGIIGLGRFGTALADVYKRQVPEPAR